MKTSTIRATIREEGNSFIITPANNADKISLGLLVSEHQGKYLTVSVKTTQSSKTYDQLKTAWALIALIFESMYFRKPRESEKKQLYMELLEEFADRKTSLLSSDKTVPYTFSEMSSQQLSRFIQNLINLLSDSCDLSDSAQSDVKELFLEWQDYMSSQEEDCRDFYDNGEMIPIDEWAKKNSVSFASGLGGALDKAHIVSKGADEIHRDCCWNIIMLTHEEHMMQHQIGWDEFLKIYPHLRGRVNRARRIAHKMEIQGV